MDTRADWDATSNESVKARLWQEHAAAGPKPFNMDWLLHLTKLLQTTLEPEELIGRFVAEGAGAIPFDGASYHHEARGLRVEYGKAATHRCIYTLTVLNEELGTLTFLRATPFSEEDTERLEFLTSHLLYPLRNALLYHAALAAASKDPLTKAHNRAALDESLGRELVLAHRHGSPLALVMLDLDRFKCVNDHHGHVVGDRALQAFVSAVNACIRSSDTLFRYGGEEFTLVLRNTDLDGAVAVAERIRSSVESLRMDINGVTLALTVSLGVTELAENDDAAGILERADCALYRSKAEGRNRVTARR